MKLLLFLMVFLTTLNYHQQPIILNSLTIQKPVYYPPDLFFLRETPAQFIDKDVEVNYIPLTKEQLRLKRLGYDCVTCNPNAKDPNMRPEHLRGFDSYGRVITQKLEKLPL